jgi:hypothetical protein
VARSGPMEASGAKRGGRVAICTTRGGRRRARQRAERPATLCQHPPTAAGRWPSNSAASDRNGGMVGRAGGYPHPPPPLWGGRGWGHAADQGWPLARMGLSPLPFERRRAARAAVVAPGDRLSGKGRRFPTSSDPLPWRGMVGLHLPLSQDVVTGKGAGLTGQGSPLRDEAGPGGRLLAISHLYAATMERGRRIRRYGRRRWRRNLWPRRRASAAPFLPRGDGAMGGRRRAKGGL